MSREVSVILRVGHIQYGFKARHFMNDAYVAELVPAREPVQYDTHSGDFLDAEPGSFVFEGRWMKEKL